MKNLFIWISVFIGVTSCQKSSSPTSLEKESQLETQVAGPDSTLGSFTQDDQGNIVRLLQLTLLDKNKEGIQQGWIDSLSRSFKYSQVDLNADSKKEILVGMTGPAFCGSGGCTLLLLDPHGNIITEFTVVDYPVYVAKESSNGWLDLVMYSGSKNRRVKFNGQTYPTNPSVLEEYSGQVDQLTKLLDWVSLEGYRF
jgi:hypothetical protein